MKKFFANIFNAIKDFFKNPGKKLKAMIQTGWYKSICASIICILIGILIGFIVMIIVSLFNPEASITDPFDGFVTLILGPFNSKTSVSLMKNIGNMIFYSVPLIMTGLSVAIAYKTGLFNIGAPGQYLMGLLASLLVALSIPTTSAFAGFLVWILAVLAGVLAGAIWGMIPGALKAWFNINEVIICIMTNWIAANLVTWVFTLTPNLYSKVANKGGFLATVTNNVTPKLGFDSLFPGSLADFGIVLAILIAVAVYIILNKTTFGFGLRACGSNRNAAKYAGLNEKKNIMFSMAIAGGLAGLGACFYYLNSGIEFKYISQYASLPAYGFNGIASAFLANCNPIGIIFSSLFIRFLNCSGDFLTSCGYNRYVADVIISVIIYLAGFTRIINTFITKVNKKIIDKSELKAQKIENSESKDEKIDKPELKAEKKEVCKE